MKKITLFFIALFPLAVAVFIFFLLLTTTEEVNAANSCVFTSKKYLRVGARHNDVLVAQRILNQDPSTRLSVSGLGSVGKETLFFGKLTRLAIIKFQTKYKAKILTPRKLLKASGVLDASTRAQMLLLCKKDNNFTRSVPVIPMLPTIAHYTQPIPINSVLTPATPSIQSIPANSASIPAAPLVNFISEPIIAVPQIRPTPREIKLLTVIMQSTATNKSIVTKDEVEKIIFTSSTSLKNYFLQNSYGALHITGDVIGPIAANYPEMPFHGINLSKAIAGADPYVDFRNYGYVIFISDQGGGCDGGASLGQDQLESADGIVSLGYAFGNGQCVKDFNDPTQIAEIIHELGHAFGLKHVAAWRKGVSGCSNIISLSNLSGDTCYSEYGGGTPMGNARGGLYVYQRNKLAGPSFIAPQLTVVNNGDYWIHWFNDNSELKYYEELRIPAINGYYSIEFRKNITNVIERGVAVNFVPNDINMFFGGVFDSRRPEILLIGPRSETLKAESEIYNDTLRNILVEVLKIEENRALLRIKVR